MKRKPRSIYTIDCETDPFDGSIDIQPFIWDVFDGKTHATFESVSDVHAFMEANPGIYYAHNGGRFDFLLGGFARRADADQEVLMINGRLVRFRMLGCECRDSFAILPSALADLGDSGRGKLDIDYAKLKRGVRARHMQEIVEYLHCDTSTLWRAIVAFRDSYGDHLTLAGAAMAKLRELVCDGDAIPHLTASQDAALRPYYHGGRVEAFQTGIITHAFRVYDIASAYPRAMIENHAWGSDMVTGGATQTIIPQGFYHVECDSDGALPVRVRGEGLTFPTGRVMSLCTGWELLAGIETHTVRNMRVRSHIVFAASRSMKAYVNRFYALKRTAPKGSHARTFAKLMLNSGYGKLGADPERYENTTTVATVEEAAAHASLGYRMHAEPLGGDGGPWLVSRPLYDEEKRRHNVATAASITGWVRAHLWRAIVDARRQGRVLYCDTDSLATTATMVTGEQLGDWTLDAECLPGSGIAGRKLYAFRTATGWKTACKGAKLEPREILSVARGSTVSWNASAPTLRAGARARMITRAIRKR